MEYANEDSIKTKCIKCAVGYYLKLDSNGGTECKENMNNCDD